VEWRYRWHDERRGKSVFGLDRCMGWRERPRPRTACQNHSAPSSVSYGQLELLPFWDPLPNDPCFDEIVALFAPRDAQKKNKLKTDLRFSIHNLVSLISHYVNKLREIFSRFLDF
jgi:hypothetical protein